MTCVWHLNKSAATQSGHLISLIIDLWLELFFQFCVALTLLDTRPCTRLQNFTFCFLSRQQNLIHVCLGLFRTFVSVLNYCVLYHFKGDTLSFYSNSVVNISKKYQCSSSCSNYQSLTFYLNHILTFSRVASRNIRDTSHKNWNTHRTLRIQEMFNMSIVFHCRREFRP